LNTISKWPSLLDHQLLAGVQEPIKLGIRSVLTKIFTDSNLDGLVVLIVYNERWLGSDVCGGRH
jgi:hypothetical protein